MADFSKDCQISYDGLDGLCTIRFRCFDTPNSVTVYGVTSEDLDAENLLRSIHRECLEFHRLWSFSMRGSDIWRINESVERVVIDSRTGALLSGMKRFYENEPAFDFTVGSVSFLWKHAASVPSDGEIEHALSHVGVDKVFIEDNMVVKADPLVRVDVGGAAKGYVADFIAARLRKAGIECAAIDLGGNLYMLGNHPSGRPWRIAVRVPEGLDVARPVVEAQDASVVTSGSYERFIEIDGRRYQHIVDALTGRPSESNLVSVTVVSSSSFQADMLATTALLTGSQGLKALEARHPAASFIPIAR